MSSGEMKIRKREQNKEIKSITVASRFKTHLKFSAGGAERQMALIGKELIKWNVDFHYITRKQNKNQKNFEVIDGIKIQNLIDKPNSKIKKILFDFFYSYDLFFFLRHFYKLNFDIYHFREIGKFLLAWFFIIKLVKKKKVVITIPHINFCIPDRIHFGKFFRPIYKYCLKKADLIIVLANYMKKELYKNYNVKSIIIKSGHPVPKGPFKKNYPPIILWIARLKDWKRPNLFLQIAKELSNLDAEFLLIGAQDNYYKNEIVEFSSKYKNFTFIPGIPQGEDNNYYEKASLIVNTSTFEGFPNSFIQAWLREAPVISLSVDPDCVICKDGLGYHAKGDINKMIFKIKELIEDPEKLNEMGKNCRNYAIQNHDIKKTAEQHYKIYKWLLEKK